MTFRAVGDTATIVARVTDANGHTIESAQVSWASGDATVATVDSAGLVTAVSTGSAEVTAKAGGAEASAAVIVEFRAVSDPA